METKDFFKREFLCWDDVAHLGAEQRKAVILREAEIKPSKYGNNKMDLVITLQLAYNKLIYSFRVNRRTWNNLKEEYGTNSKDWVEKVVVVEKFVYGDNKEGIELKVWHGDKPKVKAEAAFNNIGDLLSNAELMASVSTIMQEMKNIKKSKENKI